MYKKEKENKERIYISSPIYPMYYLLHKKISISNNMILRNFFFFHFYYL